MKKLLASVLSLLLILLCACSALKPVDSEIQVREVQRVVETPAEAAPGTSGTEALPAAAAAPAEEPENTAEEPAAHAACAGSDARTHARAHAGTDPGADARADGALDRRRERRGDPAPGEGIPLRADLRAGEPGI